jgi:tRNA nucleotidyltransferase (CCA-adding enzyme)
MLRILNITLLPKFRTKIQANSSFANFYPTPHQKKFFSDNKIKPPISNNKIYQKNLFSLQQFFTMEIETTSLDPKITLTPKEQSLFTLLSKITESKNLEITLRVAGGWVRDKLLGQESHDIDIALDTMMGSEFVEIIRTYFVENNLATSKGFGVIKANADKSKHLETATINIDGEWIDFVNLRKEDYAADSRVPEIQIGTPTEDAFRRDLTINSLFYNISERKIEDFTGLGLQDLKDQRIRTPIDPTKTFFDDPLRILRVFRFAARFGYQVDPETMKS